MTSVSHRERVLKALNHEETDRVPLDVGGSSATGINLHAYENLKKHLGLDIKTKVLSDRSQLARIDEHVLQQPHPTMGLSHIRTNGGLFEQNLQGGITMFLKFLLKGLMCPSWS
jgi:hypothetical protein